MLVIDSNTHLVQRTDDSEIRALMEEPYCQDSFPVFPGTGWDATNSGQFGTAD